MKSTSTGMASGCVVWVIVFSLLGSCLCPLGLMTAGFTSQTDFVTQTVGSRLCPKDTAPELYSYDTMSPPDEYGVSRPATAYELICLDANGQTVVNLGPTYAFIWTGMLGIAGLILAAIVAVLLAGPAGILAARVFGRKKDSAIGVP